MSLNKSIVVSVTTWKKLQGLKLDLGKATLDDVITMLVDKFNKELDKNIPNETPEWWGVK